MIRLFDKDSWSLDSLIPPWGESKSIYRQIRNGVTDPLPDEHVIFQPDKLRWVGGAMDGVLGHHTQNRGTEKRVFRIVSTLEQLQRRADNKLLRGLYELVVEDAVVSCIDVVLEQLTNSLASPDKSRLLEVGRYFATRAGHREAVKFGLALIGVFGTAQDAEILKTLGKNEEFTLFAAVALPRVTDNPEQALWELARSVHGWGRIQVVSRLKDTHNPVIQAWMLREGFRNDVMDEYLACVCARTGRLHKALNQQFVDAPLLDGAADIIRALITGGPAEGIDEYEFSADVCERYLNIVWSRTDISLRHFLTVAKLRWFLTQPDRWEKRRELGWTDSRRQTMQSLADDVFSRDACRQEARKALASDAEQVFHEGDEAAQWLSMDTWELHFARVKTNPLTSSSWYRLMQQTDEARIDQVLTFAESVLPFEQIETGASDKLGLGPNFQPHQAIDWILQDLRRFPSRGWRIIKAGLLSPVVRNRNMAIHALAGWPRQSWNAEIRSFVRGARDIEPQQDVRRRFDSLLAGTPVS